MRKFNLEFFSDKDRKYLYKLKITMPRSKHPSTSMVLTLDEVKNLYWSLRMLRVHGLRVTNPYRKGV